MPEPLRDDHFAIEVSEKLDDNQAMLTVDGKRLMIQFGELSGLAAAIEKLAPSEVLMSKATHEKFVAEMATLGVNPSTIN
jgi:hypothetical protein